MAEQMAEPTTGPTRCTVADDATMTTSPSPAAWGVAEGYADAAGSWRQPPQATLDAVLAAMGAGADPAPPRSRLAGARPGGPTGAEGPVEVTTEDGAALRVEAGGRLPGDLPAGYHTLTDLSSGESSVMVVSPGACVLPAAPTWGWALQLYAARSRESWGMGDLADLAELGRWSAGELGAGLVLVNPLHAALPGLPQGSSPYYPSSRRFRNPLYLRVEEVPGASTLGPVIDDVAAAGRRLNEDRRIDRDEVFRLKMAALAELWQRFPGDDGFARWCREQGPALENYGTFCALVDEHGSPWRDWPEAVRHPDGPGIAGFRARRRRQIDFHRWLQWLVDSQLARASREVAVVQDLAVGFDPDGADAWEWQDVVASGMSVGAPPDEFNTRGQDWGLPPFDPWRLRAAGYRPFVETLRAVLNHAGGLRLDHVMGLFRLFWVPHGAGPADGTYVRYPAADLLDIVALESHRAGAWVVGEDLGTVEDDVRRELAARNVLSYRLVWFEPGDPAGYPERALAAVTTHDLPTVAGLWSGSDLEAQRRLGMDPNEAGTEDMRRHIAAVAGVTGGAPADEVVAGVHRALGRAPSLLLTAGLDDALAVEERPNMPGTTDEWPNWSIALPAGIEEIESDLRPRRIAGMLRRDGGDDDAEPPGTERGRSR
jgi:4-alpha-glucanotransferase